jgi:integrase
MTGKTGGHSSPEPGFGTPGYMTPATQPRPSCLNRTSASGVVQQILGHSQLSQTERYTHVTTALSQHAADRISEALWG